jgi:O-antigen/teichoic acid export membrane protein
MVSYVFIPYRPRLTLSKARELWSFSIWSLINSIGNYCATRADHVAVAAALGSEAMGTYTVGAELAALPTEELVVPPVRALYAVYARVSHDQAAMQAHYLTALSFVALVACATSTGVALVAEDAVTVVLGPRWSAAAPMLPWIALASGAMGVARSVNPILMATGHARANALRGLTFAALLLFAALIGADWRGVEGVAIARLVVTLVFVPVMFALLVRLLNVPVVAILRTIWRPLGAAAGMVVAVTAIHPYWPSIPWIRLLGDAVVGAAAYASVLATLWLCAGRPAGAERTIVTWLDRRT